MDQKGETLIEVIVAMVILSMLVISYFSWTTISFTSISNYGKKTIALNYAREITEEIKAYSSYSNLNNEFLSKPAKMTGVKDIYKYDVSFSPSYSSGNKLYDISVTITFPTHIKMQNVVLQSKLYLEP